MPQSTFAARPAQDEPCVMRYGVPEDSLISRPSSPQTSIYSVPSTRLTDITSAHTGATVTAAHTYRGDSPRSSMVFDSAPPSYYDGRSIRERSRSRSRSRVPEDNQHPVLSSDWFAGLLQNAEAMRHAND